MTKIFELDVMKLDAPGYVIDKLLEDETRDFYRAEIVRLFSHHAPQENAEALCLIYSTRTELMATYHFLSEYHFARMSEMMTFAAQNMSMAWHVLKEFHYPNSKLIAA